MKEVRITSAEVLGTMDTSPPKRRGNRATRVPAIIEVSMNVFNSHGNAGFTQRRVAGEAGIHLRTLQHYFSSREERLRAVFEEFNQRYLDRFRSIAQDKSRSPEACLNAIVDETFAVLTETGINVSAFVLEAWSLAEHERFAHDVVAKGCDEFQDMFAKLVARMNPSLTAGECTLRGALLLSHLQGLAVFIRRAGDNKPELDAFRHATKVVWKGISTAAQ